MANKKISDTWYEVRRYAWLPGTGRGTWIDTWNGNTLGDALEYQDKLLLAKGSRRWDLDLVKVEMYGKKRTERVLT